jgi:hypothetical protein
VPMTVVLEVIVVFMATRLVAAARKVDVRMIALVRAMAVVGQETTSSRSSGRTRLEGARCVPVRRRGCADHSPRYESPVEGNGSPVASQPEVGEGFGRPSARSRRGLWPPGWAARARRTRRTAALRGHGTVGTKAGEEGRGLIGRRRPGIQESLAELATQLE